jgi:predicted metalloprotease with PDZ domain
MTELWQRFGRAERPYTQADLQATLADLTGDRAFAEDFFSRYIDGREVMEYERLLGYAGLLLRPANPGTAWIGSPALRFDENGAQVMSTTLIDTPLHNAGVTAGDRIVMMAGNRMDSEAALTGVLGSLRPGDRLSIVYEQRGETRTAEMTVSEDPRLEVVTYESVGREVTPVMQGFRNEWLRSRAVR